MTINFEYDGVDVDYDVTKDDIENYFDDLSDEDKLVVANELFNKLPKDIQDVMLYDHDREGEFINGRIMSQSFARDMLYEDIDFEDWVDAFDTVEYDGFRNYIIENESENIQNSGDTVRSDYWDYYSDRL